MGILTDQFVQAINEVANAADAALADMGDHLVDTLIENAMEKVYSYTPQLYFLQKRRGELVKDANYKKTQGYLSIKIENTAVTQMGAPGEINWVESGYRQHGAGARPYMEDSLAKYVSSEASQDLVNALQAAGFDAHVS